MHLLKGRGKGATGSRERGSQERNPEPAREAEAATRGLPGRAGAGGQLPGGRTGLRESRERGRGAEKAKGRLCPPSPRPGLGPEERSSLPAPPRPRPPVSLRRRALPSGRAPPVGRAQGVGEPAGSARKRPGPAGTPTPGKGPARPRTRTHRALRGEGAGERSGAGSAADSARVPRAAPAAPRHLATAEAPPPAHAQQPRTLAALDVARRCLLSRACASSRAPEYSARDSGLAHA